MTVSAGTRIRDRADRSPASARVHAEPLPEVAGLRPMDVAEAFRGQPGLALLESGRPGRGARWSFLSADPLAVVEEPSAGADPFADARRAMARVDSGPAALSAGLPAGTALPPYAGGLIGFLGYDLGRSLERLPSLADDDQGLPVLRLALHDWVVAWDHRTGGAWLLGRAVDGDLRRLARRTAEVRDRVVGFRPPVPAPDLPPLALRSNMTRPAYRAAVEAVRTAIAAGEIYQANLARRLEAPFAADPWPLFRRLRTGDPAIHAAYLDLGPGGAKGCPGLHAPETEPGPRAIMSASPEPFLAVSSNGSVQANPIKGTRPRGRDRAADRDLARELLASAKDRAENVMIVDVLRNDLGRVCQPGSVRVPRLCRLERTTAVQHLVSTVTGRLARDRDVFDLLAAAFPGGSITGAPKIRAMEILEELEPVRRGPYTGAAGWIGPDGAMATSILIRTFVADGHRLTLHVGGGITWRSDPDAEWAETVAKAAGPLAAVDAREIE